MCSATSGRVSYGLEAVEDLYQKRRNDFWSKTWSSKSSSRRSTSKIKRVKICRRRVRDSCRKLRSLFFGTGYVEMYALK